mgnify:CR=1 FL=1
MLNIGKLAVNGGEYYLEVVASGVEDYYLGAGEAPGWWTGTAASQLGLSGRVNASDLEAVLAGTHPRTGEALRSGRGGPRLPGFDLTFRAPKSVSLLWALSTPDVAEDVRACHDRAVATALEFLERHAIGTRRGTNGVEHVEADGAVAAVFRHRTSRAGDPLLHSHVLVANLAHTIDDDRWRTLNGRLLYTHSKTAGFVYQAVLRHELTSTLGVAWQRVVNGTADLQGVSREVIEHFSRRRADILAALDATGHSSAKAAQVATLATRQRKEYGVSPATLTDRWTSRAQAIAFGPDRVGRLLFQDHRRELDAIDVDQVMHALGGPDGLTERTSTFRRRDVVRAWCDRLPLGATLETLERLTDATLDSEIGVAVLLAQPVPATSPVSSDVERAMASLSATAGEPAGESQPLRHVVSLLLTQGEMRPDELVKQLLAESLGGVRDPVGVLTWRARRVARQMGVQSDLTGGSAAIGARPPQQQGSTETVYSTHDLLAGERQALDQASTAVATVRCEATQVDRVLAAHQFLAQEQVQMVRQITTGTEGVQVVVGRAGAGKTTALAAAVPLWRAAGCTVMGAALAARTAQQLGEETGMPATSVDGLLAELDTNPLRHTDVMVIDEAAMVGTRKLARLIDHACTVGARLVLVGDHHQLPEIDAGGLFRALTHSPHAVELVTNRRQEDPEERAAVNAIRDHNDAVAVAHFTKPERHRVHETAEQAVAAVVEGWWTDRTAGRTTIMLAGHHDQVALLNANARERLDQAGELYGPETVIGGTGYRVGDQILCLRNNRRLGVLNGTTVTIDVIAPGELHATDAHGRAVVLPLDYIENGDIAHAYATTVHKAQGRTVDSSHVLVDDTAYRQLTYVMLSRHRQAARIHRPAHVASPDGDAIHTRGRSTQGAAEIETALARDRSQNLALESTATVRLTREATMGT